MQDELQNSKELLSPNPIKRIYNSFAAGVAYISITDRNGNENIGSCFHIGDGVFITAKHVLENNKIKEIGTTVEQFRYFETDETKSTGAVRVEIPYTPNRTSSYLGIYLHPNVDVAAIVAPEIEAPTLVLGDHLDNFSDNGFILSEAVVMGYPPIPFSQAPVLISSKCEVNGIVDKYTGGHPHFILSSMARGGFSGGPAISISGIVLGVVTESLVYNNQPTELGYLSVMSVEGIYECISHHSIVPKNIDERWDGFWNTQTIMYACSTSDHISVSLYKREGKFYITLFSFRNDILQKAIEVTDAKLKSGYNVDWVHENMFKIRFMERLVTEKQATRIYISINKMITSLGIKRLGEIDLPDGLPF